MLEIRIKRNPGYSEHSGDKVPRYFFELDLSGVIKGGRQATVPVFWRLNKSPHPILKEIYSVEIAGITVEKGNLLALERAVPDAVQALADYGTLPYYFIDLPGRGRTPVYLVDGKLQTRLSDGPQLGGDDIGQLWHRLGDYLIGMKEIKSKEDIAVSLLYWKELRIYPSAFVLRNANHRIWIPIFHKEENLNYDVIGQPSRLLPLSEAFHLRDEIAASLTAAKMLSSPFDLGMAQVQREFWDRLERIVAPTDRMLSYYVENTKVELPIFEVPGELLALEMNSTARINFGRDIEELQRRAAEELVREHRISSTSYLGIETKGRR